MSVEEIIVLFQESCKTLEKKPSESMALIKNIIPYWLQREILKMIS